MSRPRAKTKPYERCLTIYELDLTAVGELLGRKITDRRTLTVEDLWKLSLHNPLLDLNKSVEQMMTLRRP